MEINSLDETVKWYFVTAAMSINSSQKQTSEGADNLNTAQ